MWNDKILRVAMAKLLPADIVRAVPYLSATFIRQLTSTVSGKKQTDEMKLLQTWYKRTESTDISHVIVQSIQYRYFYIWI